MVKMIIIEDADEETIRRILRDEKSTTIVKIVDKKIDEQKIIPIRKEQSKEQSKKKKKAPPEQSSRPKRIFWTKKEDRIIKDFYKNEETINPKKLSLLLPLRTPNAIHKRASTIEASNIKRRKRKFESNKTTSVIPETPKIIKGSLWTKEEKETLKTIYAENPEGLLDQKKLKRLLPNRTIGTIYVNACKMGLGNHKRLRDYKGRKTSATKEPQTETKEPTTKRGSFTPEQRKKGLNSLQQFRKFMQERKSKYQIYGHNESDSYRLALVDWHRQKHGQTTVDFPTQNQAQPVKKECKIIENFPNFETVNKDFNTLIESIVKHVIANKGSKLTYLNTKDILDIDNGRRWHDFVAEFMAKSPVIAEYFIVPNKFRHIRENDRFDVIIYGDN